MPKCPQCNCPLTFDESRRPSCAVCGAALPWAATADESAPVALTSEPVWAVPTHGPRKNCELCDQQAPPLTPRVVRVYTQSLGVTGNVKGRWVDIRCHCCESCYDQGRQLGRVVGRAIWMWVFSIPLGVAAGLGSAYLIELLGGTTNHVIYGILGAALFFFATLFVVAPLYVSRSYRRGVQAIFQGSKTEELFRRSLGIKRWGFWSRLSFYPAPEPGRSKLAAWLFGGPRAEDCVELSQLRRLG